MQGNRDIDPKKFLNLSSAREKLEFLVFLANLSPSSHNMQPWLFKIQDNKIVVLPNFRLKLTVADLDSREFYLTLGTVIGSLKLVSSSYGLQFKQVISDDLKSEIVRFEFTDLTSKNPDFETLTAYINRHNSRLPFSKKDLNQNFFEKLEVYSRNIAELKIINNTEVREKVENNVLDSVREAFADKAFCLELAPWIKPSIGHHEDGLPGYNLGMPFFISLIFPFMVRNMNISNLQVKIHKRMLDNSSVYAVISSDEESPLKWLTIGEMFLQIAVEAQKNKISIGIMQASIENPKNRKELQRIIGSEKLPQMFFRLGYCDLVHKHSPRRALGKVLINS